MTRGRGWPKTTVYGGMTPEVARLNPASHMHLNIRRTTWHSVSIICSQPSPRFLEYHRAPRQGPDIVASIHFIHSLHSFLCQRCAPPRTMWHGPHISVFIRLERAELPCRGKAIESRCRRIVHTELFTNPPTLCTPLRDCVVIKCILCFIFVSLCPYHVNRVDRRGSSWTVTYECDPQTLCNPLRDFVVMKYIYRAPFWLACGHTMSTTSVVEDRAG
jgi:hypothetical protein